MLFSSDWRTLFVVLSLLKFSAINCDPWSGIGTVSSVYAVKNCRRSMEDYFIQIEGVSGYGIFGVFDGHGGKHASSFAATHFAQKIQDNIKQFANEPERCEYKEDSKLNFELMLNASFAQAEAHLKKEFVENGQGSGTTCLLVIAEERKLTVANLGDSRGVMCNFKGTAIDLSIDHKPDSKKEKKRIKKAGGSIYLDGSIWTGVYRVKELAMSRALGDHSKELEKKIISGEPDIATYDLDKYRPKFLILATDGVWDVISSQKAVNFIKSRYSSEEDFGAKDLAEHAMKLKSKDNIAVVIVNFNENGHYEVGSASV